MTHLRARPSRSTYSTCRDKCELFKFNLATPELVVHGGASSRAAFSLPRSYLPVYPISRFSARDLV